MTNIDQATSDSGVHRQLFIFDTNKHEYWGIKPCIDVIYYITYFHYLSNIELDFLKVPIIYCIEFMFKFVTKIYEMFFRNLIPVSKHYSIRIKLSPYVISYYNS